MPRIPQMLPTMVVQPWWFMLHLFGGSFFPPLQQLAPTAYLWVNILQRSNARVVDEFMGGSLDHLLMQARAQTWQKWIVVILLLVELVELRLKLRHRGEGEWKRRWGELLIKPKRPYTCTQWHSWSDNYVIIVTMKPTVLATIFLSIFPWPHVRRSEI